MWTEYSAVAARPGPMVGPCILYFATLVYITYELYVYTYICLRIFVYICVHLVLCFNIFRHILVELTLEVIAFSYIAVKVKLALCPQEAALVSWH